MITPLKQFDMAVDIILYFQLEWPNSKRLYQYNTTIELYHY